MGYRLPFFPMYAAETLADGRFQGWNLEERGAWLTLLCYAWNDGTIPADHSCIARLLHVDAGDMARIWSAIGDRFAPHPTEPGRLVSPRLEEERDHAESLGKVRSRAGKKGAEARWNKGNSKNSNRIRLPKRPQSDGDAVEKANRCPGPSPSPSPETSPSSPRARLVSPFPPGADPYPLTTAVLAALFERRIDAAPPADRSAPRVEAAIAAVGVDVAVERLAAVYADPNAKRPLTYHVDAIRALTKPAPRGDLGVELRPWTERLTAEEKRRARAELAALHPDLEDAPLGIPGVPGVHPVEAIADLNARWRAVAEGRP